MRKFLIILLVMVGAVTANAQHALEPGKPYMTYCDVMGYNNWGIGKLKVILNFGDNAKNECSIYGEDGKKVKFNTMMEVLDYMAKRGWTLKQTYYITEGKANVVHYVMEKTITEDKQIEEGLIVRKSDDK